jgi:hypothetical protein
MVSVVDRSQIVLISDIIIDILGALAARALRESVGLISIERRGSRNGQQGSNLIVVTKQNCVLVEKCCPASTCPGRGRLFAPNAEVITPLVLPTTIAFHRFPALVGFRRLSQGE